MYSQLEEKMAGHAFYNLNELNSRIIHIEEFIKEKEKNPNMHFHKGSLKTEK